MKENNQYKEEMQKKRYITKLIRIDYDNNPKYLLGYDLNNELYFDEVSKEEFELREDLAFLKFDKRKQK
jgi:hypothetical protein